MAECLMHEGTLKRMGLKKLDKKGQQLFPGDVCVRLGRAGPYSQNLEFIVYKGEVFGGKGSKGEFGRFITSTGMTSIKYSSVVFAFDPVGDRRSEADEIKTVLKKYYEGE